MIRSARTAAAFAFAALFSTSPAFAQAAESFRIGAISLEYVATHSKSGKAALAAIDEFGRKKSLEIESKAAELQQQQAQLQQQSAAMSPRAAADLQRAFEKSRLEFNRIQQDAQTEIRALQSKFDAAFRIELQPIVDAISKEKGLHFVFGLEQAAIIWWSPLVDISDEVVKRLDVAK